MLVGTAPGRAQHAGGMRFVDHEETAELLFDRNQIGQRTDVAIIENTPFGNDQGTVGGGSGGQLVAEESRSLWRKR